MTNKKTHNKEDRWHNQNVHKSNTIQEVRYDERGAKLRVFKHSGAGADKAYHMVPRHHYEGLINASVPDSYLEEQIQGKYDEANLNS